MGKMNDITKIENALIVGDISKLTTDERTKYYLKTCETLGLNPITKPFDYITLNGKLTLYAKRDCTDQLRKLHNVSITITSRTLDGDIYSVTAKATTGNRTDESLGAVCLGTAKGEAKANLLMKAETKAKRRVTLSICGLGLLDETEVETVVHENTNLNLNPVTQATPKTLPMVQKVTQTVEAQKAKLKEIEEQDALIKAVDEFAGIAPKVTTAKPVEHHDSDSLYYRRQKELNNKPTEKQINMIGGLVKDIGLRSDMASEWLRQSFGVPTREELTRKQASQAIETLMQMRDTGEPDIRSVANEPKNNDFSVSDDI